MGEATQALETTERVLAALRLLPDRDPALEVLIGRIEDDRAHLLAAIIDGQALRRSTARIRRPITAPEEAWPSAALLAEPSDRLGPCLEDAAT
jgi:hypothetical protein